MAKLYEIWLDEKIVGASGEGELGYRFIRIDIISRAFHIIKEISD